MSATTPSSTTTAFFGRQIKAGAYRALYLPAELGPDFDRLRTRAWTHMKTGQ